MEELLKSAIKYHTISIGFMLIIASTNLYFIFGDKNFSKKVKMLNPLYYMFFAIVGFSGVIVLAIYQFSISHMVWLMIAVFLIIFVMSMKLYKVYKYQHSKYRAFAKKKYLLDVALMVLTMSLVYMVR